MACVGPQHHRIYIYIYIYIYTHTHTYIHIYDANYASYPDENLQAA